LYLCSVIFIRFCICHALDGVFDSNAIPAYDSLIRVFDLNVIAGCDPLMRVFDPNAIVDLIHNLSSLKDEILNQVQDDLMIYGRFRMIFDWYGMIEREDPE